MTRLALFASAAAALFPLDAAACSCYVFDSGWPSGVKDVPRSTHVFVWSYGSRPQDEFELVELPTPPAGWSDEVSAKLLSVVRPIFPKNESDAFLRVWELKRPERYATVDTARRLRRHHELPFRTVVELTPKEPLKPFTRYMVIKPMATYGGVLAVFATGSQSADPRNPVSQVEIAKLSKPNPDAASSACEVATPFAEIGLKPMESEPSRVLAIWDLTSGKAVDDSAPDEFILSYRGHAFLGRESSCSTNPVELPGSGTTMKLQIREVTLLGQLGPPFHLEFVVPEPWGGR